MRTPPTIWIEAQTIPEAWERAVHDVVRYGATVPSEYGPLTKDTCSLITIKEPFSDPMLHPDFPTKAHHMEEYKKQWQRGYDWIKQGFSYNYINRLTAYPVSTKLAGEYYVHDNRMYHVTFTDQMNVIRHRISKNISRRLQAITWIPARDLITEADMPCLQRLWFRNLGDNNIEVHCTWRSRDLYNAWNSSIVALLHMVRREVTDPNNLTIVKVVDFCDSLHIYEADWEDALKIKITPRSLVEYLSSE